ncbi:MAG: hypothetical protein ACFFD6_10445 [Candidatus Thorarchaeota archaeon]
MKLVIKVGGSLIDELYPARTLLKTIATIAEQRSVLVVPGGGAFADIIRVAHSKGFVSDSAAHWLAIKCMDLNAMIMADIQPSLNLCSEADAFDRWAEGESFIIQPYNLLKSYDRLPHSWGVTSDSIALWLGIQGDADAVVLLKSTDPFTKRGSTIQSETEVVRPNSLQHLVNEETIDPYIASLLPEYKGDFYVLNGRMPDSLLGIIEQPTQ